MKDTRFATSGLASILPTSGGDHGEKRLKVACTESTEFDQSSDPSAVGWDDHWGALGGHLPEKGLKVP